MSAAAVVNTILLFNGTFLLSWEFGWKAGVGFLMLALFVKDDK